MGTAGNVMPFEEKKPEAPKEEKPSEGEEGSGEAEDEEEGKVPAPEMGGMGEEKEPEPEPEPPCCERYGDFCTWIEPDSDEVDPGDQKL